VAGNYSLEKLWAPLRPGVAAIPTAMGASSDVLKLAYLSPVIRQPRALFCALYQMHTLSAT